MPIHPTAVIADDANLAEDIEIGPYAIIEPEVTIGPGARIAGHVQIVNRVEIGKDCEIGHGAVIGANPQDKSFARDTASGVVIGDGNTFREHVTIHRSTTDGGATRIGDRNYLMVGCHVGHNSVVGDDNTFANGCLLGGHVTVGNSTFLGGGAGFHQFVRVGDHCMIRGLSAISQDVPPFVMVSGSNQVRGLNVVGMSRAGFDKDQRLGVKAAFNHIYRAGLNLSQALQAAGEIEWVDEGAQFIEFFRAASKKGVCRLGA